MVDLLFERPMYVAPFERVPGLGRFILRDEGVIMGMGRIMELKQKHWRVCLVEVFLECSMNSLIILWRVTVHDHQQTSHSLSSRSFR